MRKKDPEINENIDRTPGSDSASPVEDKPGTYDANPNIQDQFTNVKNASASGLGTMGRSDEKIADQASDKSSDVY